MPTSSSKNPFRSDCLQDKVALVTGGGSGIGLEITRQLLRHGCRGVVICGRRKAFLQRAAELLQQETGKLVFYAVCDVRDANQSGEAVNLAKNKFGRLDILVNGAAGNFLAAAKDISPRGFATVMAIDALGTFNMSHAAYGLLKDGCGGIVINISATLHHGATYWQAHASAAKAAVDSLTRSLAIEWGPDNIRVAGIAPGPIADTPGTSKLAPQITNASGQSSQLSDRIPLGRMGETTEIALAAIYLCTAQYVTGTVLVVDGGERLHREPWVPKELVAVLSRKAEAASRAQTPMSRL
jgi:peroxisomal 2,4-dienoyl-CoA reductase